jgi:hypothetical protein
MNFPLPEGLTMGTIKFLDRDENFRPSQHFFKNRATVAGHPCLERGSEQQVAMNAVVNGELKTVWFAKSTLTELQREFERYALEASQREAVRRFKASKLLYPKR